MEIPRKKVRVLYDIKGIYEHLGEEFNYKAGDILYLSERELKNRYIIEGQGVYTYYHSHDIEVID